MPGFLSTRPMRMSASHIRVHATGCVCSQLSAMARNSKPSNMVKKFQERGVASRGNTS